MFARERDDPGTEGRNRTDQHADAGTARLRGAAHDQAADRRRPEEQHRIQGHDPPAEGAVGDLLQARVGRRDVERQRERAGAEKCHREAGPGRGREREEQHAPSHGGPPDRGDRGVRSPRRVEGSEHGAEPTHGAECGE